MPGYCVSPWGLVCVLLFLHRWSALVGWLSVLECASWGFLPLFALLHLFPLYRLFVTASVSPGNITQKKEGHAGHLVQEC